jgi:hypothetical protein
MELNIAELDKVSTQNPYHETFDYNNYEQNSVNYWEKSVKPENKEKRRKVSFNDILSNMNLLVNNQGVLQFMVPSQEENAQNEYQQQNNQYNPNNFSQPIQYQKSQSVPQQQSINPKQNPLDPSVKHSYIYNKYFKDYVDPNAQKVVARVPKTIEEYRQMLLEDRIKAIEHKKRIDQIKSTKLLFTTTPGSGSNPRNMVASRNNLRKMSFG